MFIAYAINLKIHDACHIDIVSVEVFGALMKLTENNHKFATPHDIIFHIYLVVQSIRCILW